MSSDCKNSTRKCINCLLSNNKHNLKLNVDHDVFSNDCGTYCKVKERQKNKLENV